MPVRRRRRLPSDPGPRRLRACVRGRARDAIGARRHRTARRTRSRSRVAEPTSLGRPHRRRAGADARDREWTTGWGADARAAQDRRPARGRGVAVSPRVLGRPEATYRRGPCARGEPGLHRRRRAGVRARRLDSGADHQPSREPAEGLPAHVSLHRARSRRRPPHLRPHRRDVSRRDRRGISPADELYDHPLHPYTISLLSAVPIPDPKVERERETILLQGDLPSPAAPPQACRFHTRCPYVQPTRCRDERPQLRRLLPGHEVACHWAEQIRSGEIKPREREPVFEPGPVEPPPELPPV